MAIQMGKALAFTAVGGIVAGLVGCGGGEKPADDATKVEGADKGEAAKADKCSCKGHNECKQKGKCKVEGKQDCAGKNECKGQGGCKAPECGDSAAPAPAAPPAAN
jgi:hypothetical protein